MAMDSITLQTQLHQRIKLAREHAGFIGKHGRREFASAVGVTYETVRAWETKAGVQQIAARNAQRIVEVTGVRGAWLVSGEGPMVPGDEPDKPTFDTVLQQASRLTEREQIRVASAILENVSQARGE